MGYRILRHGVPLARCDELEHGHDMAAADLEALPGYATVQPIVRAAGAALRNYGILGPAADPASLSRAQDALSAAAILRRELELAREEDGLTIPTEFIDLEEWPGGASPFFAWIALRDDGAAAPARTYPPEGQSGNYERES